MTRLSVLSMGHKYLPWEESLDRGPHPAKVLQGWLLSVQAQAVGLQVCFSLPRSFNSVQQVFR